MERKKPDQLNVITWGEINSCSYIVRENEQSEEESIDICHKTYIDK